MKSIRYEKDADNIVHVIFDNPTESANLMNADFRESFAEVVGKLKSEAELAGVILRMKTARAWAQGADAGQPPARQSRMAQSTW